MTRADQLQKEEKPAEGPPITAPSPSPTTSEAIKAAPRAVRRSMPMALSITLGILLAAVLGWLFQYLIWFILILYLSFIAATILEAPVEWLMKLRLGRAPSAVLVMVGGAAVILAVIYLVANGVYGQISAVSAELTHAPERIDAYVNDLKAHFPALRNRTNDFDVAAEIVKAAPTMSTLWSNAMWGVQGVSWLVIMFFMVLYMLMDGASHLRGLRSLLPKASRLEATQLFHEMARAHRGWASASLFNVMSASTLMSTGLFLIGIPGAILLGFIAGLGELIPNVGPILGAVPAILFTLVAVPEKFWWVVLMFIVLQSIQSWTISPRMMKHSIKLPALVTIISLLAFGILFGVLGVLAAIPLVADMVVIWAYIDRRREKDATDYDEVNDVALRRGLAAAEQAERVGEGGVRTAGNVAATGGGDVVLPPPGRFRRMFRREGRTSEHTS